MERSAGILLPVFSLPGAYGIGSLKRHHRPLSAAGKYILLARQFAAAANVHQSFCGQRQFIYLQMIPFNQNATPSIIGMA